ncbi:hypothetical protein SCHPADRAFT_927252 [Schizopora paradoxa]|uniref:F-box domain-containing protein n=1 Tax=Schizopora paradoxa TaxID=27342 RepID=A0A0H2SE47_9AGAM|nr:hypothetical protein SCHPADRAFT_927252 [Schizopora paradoxa]
MEAFLDDNLEANMCKVVSNWLAHKDPILESWKEDMIPINAMPYIDLLALGSTACSQRVSQSRKSTLLLQQLSEAFNGLALAIGERYAAVSTNCYAASNMLSLITLPNELLVRIFEFVVFGDQTLSNRWWAANKLSHICQYFRNTTLSCPQLWSDISGNAKMVSLSLSRSKDAPIDVLVKINISPSYIGFDLLSQVLDHKKRWRSLTLQVVQKDPTFLPFVIFSTMAACTQHFYAVDAPLLESLKFLNYSGFLMIEENDAFSQWNTPKLRSLNFTDQIPLSLSGLASVTSLDFGLALDNYHCNSFLESLPQMTSLEILALKLQYPAGIVDANQEFERLELRVRQLKVDADFGLPRAPVRKLFSALLFPEATFLGIEISGTGRQRYSNGNIVTLDVSEAMAAIIQHDEQFLLVTQFLLRVHSAVDRIVDNLTGMVELKTGYIFLPVLIDKLPSLKDLFLDSNEHLSFNIPGPHSGDPTVETVYRTSIVHLPTLETINVVIHFPTSADGFAQFFNEILHRQKERGEWGTFRELIVTTDKQMAYGGRRETATYAGDAALAWCERRLLLINGYYPGFDTYLD